jgi:hypothetical protein
MRLRSSHVTPDDKRLPVTTSFYPAEQLPHMPRVDLAHGHSPYAVGRVHASAVAATGQIALNQSFGVIRQVRLRNVQIGPYCVSARWSTEHFDPREPTRWHTTLAGSVLTGAPAPT